jgi:FkbM family methyltransferase
LHGLAIKFNQSLKMTIKHKLLNFVFPLGSIQKIRRGYLKGFKIRLSKNSLWSPIVGRWEPDAQKIFTQIIRPGDVVFDLGANNGLHSLLFAHLVGNAGKVYAFEPLKSNCDEIAENAAINKINNIQIVNAAVGSEEGEISFHLGLHDKQGSIVRIGKGEDVKVKLITLDGFINAENRRPDFIKIDIEGAESMALQGFSHRIDGIKPIIFIELHNPEQDAKVGKFLLDHGYVAYRMTERSVANDLGIEGLEKIADMTKTYPDPAGVSGTILALHPDTIKEISSRKRG